MPLASLNLKVYSHAASSTDSSLARIPPILLKDGILYSIFLKLLSHITDFFLYRKRTTTKKISESHRDGGRMSAFVLRNVFIKNMGSILKEEP